MSSSSESTTTATQGGDTAPNQVPFTICAITYLTLPQNLPPLFNAALSLTKTGCRVEGYGTTGRLGTGPFEEIAPKFSFTRIQIRSRQLFYLLPEALGKNIVVTGLQYLLSYFEYNVKIFLKARKSAADLVEAHDLPALLPSVLIAWLRGRPLVYHAHELWPEMGPHVRFPGFWRWFEKLLIRRADLIVVPEENRAIIYREEYGTLGIPVVVANCPPFKKAPASTMLGDRITARGMKASCIVLYQGLLNDDRCVGEIIASSEYWSEGVALALIGHGFDSWSEPESLLPPGRNIIHIPHVPYERLFEYTASAQVGLLFYRNSCRNNYFCAPNKLYEYMMMGLPVITCNYPGLVPFVEGQEIGICVDPEDPRAIADAINRICGDDALRTRMRENCLRLARDRWNWESEFKILHAAYALIAGAGFPSLL